MTSATKTPISARRGALTCGAGFESEAQRRHGDEQREAGEHVVEAPLQRGGALAPEEQDEVDDLRKRKHEGRRRGAAGEAVQPLAPARGQRVVHEVEGDMLAKRHGEGRAPEDRPDEKHQRELVDPDERRAEEVTARHADKHCDEHRRDQQGRDRGR